MSQTPTSAQEAGEQNSDPDEIQRVDVGNVAYIGGTAFAVWDDAQGKAFRTDLADLTCGCDAEPQTCEHLRATVEVAHETNDSDTRITLGHIELIQQAIGVVDDAQSLVASGGAAAGGASGESGSVDDDGELVQDVPNDYDEFDLSALEDEVWDWIERAAGFKTEFDPEIVEVETGRIEGSVGFVFDTNPFRAGYHTGDEWDDQDGFNEAREAWKDITQGEDEIEYYGDPEYVNFLPAAKVEDVV